MPRFISQHKKNNDLLYWKMELVQAERGQKQIHKNPTENSYVIEREIKCHSYQEDRTYSFEAQKN